MRTSSNNNIPPNGAFILGYIYPLIVYNIFDILVSAVILTTTA